MKTVIAIIALFAVSAFAQDKEAQWIFQSWATEEGILFASAEEFQLRQNLFLANLDKIGKHNEEYELGLSSFKMGTNHFSHLSEEEFISQFTGLKAPQIRGPELAPVRYFNTTKRNIDWFDAGHVHKPKDQGSCGSCWAFSAVAAIEAANSIAGKGLNAGSEQELVDCDTKSGGCNGGWMRYAFEYVQNNGLDLGVDYPYTAKGGKCAPSGKKTIKIRGYESAGSSESTLQAAVANQPVSIAVAVDSNFQNYKSGVLDKCGIQVNHGVVAVGYNLDQDGGYWRIKNSWGERWGDNGFIRIRYGKNVCNLTYQNHYPLA